MENGWIVTQSYVLSFNFKVCNEALRSERELIFCKNDSKFCKLSLCISVQKWKNVWDVCVCGYMHSKVRRRFTVKLKSLFQHNTIQQTNKKVEVTLQWLKVSSTCLKHVRGAKFVMFDFTTRKTEYGPDENRWDCATEDGSQLTEEGGACGKWTGWEQWILQQLWADVWFFKR